MSYSSGRLEVSTVSFNGSMMERGQHRRGRSGRCVLPSMKQYR